MVIIKRIFIGSVLSVILFLFLVSCKDPLTTAMEDDSSGTYLSAPSAFTFRAQRVDNLQWYDVPAELLYNGEYSLVYVENAGREKVGPDKAREIGQEFDSVIYSLIRTKFGEESDVDGNGKITILILDIIDGGDDSSYVAGYFHPGNAYSAESFPNSNEMDMIYMDMDPGVPGSEDFYITIAHEFQHLVNFFQKVFVQGSQTGQDTWINEGLSSAAEYLYKGSQVDTRIMLYNSSSYSARSEIQNGKNFLSWDMSLANYSTVYLFFQWLRIHAVNDDAIYKEILNSTYDDYRAVENSASARIFKGSWQEFLRAWFAANAVNAEAGIYGYENEIILSPPLYEYNKNTTASLNPGWGIYTAISEPAGMTPEGSIDYAGISTTGESVDPNSTEGYSGDILLSYNINPDPRGGSESTGVLPSFIPVPPSSSLLSRSISDQTAVKKIPVDVLFTPEGTIKE